MRVWMWKERDLPTLGGTSETVLVPRSPIKHTVSMVPVMYKFTQQRLPVLYVETRGVSYFIGINIYFNGFSSCFKKGRHIACASGFSSLVPQVFYRLCRGRVFSTLPTFVHRASMFGLRGFYLWRFFLSGFYLWLPYGLWVCLGTGFYAWRQYSFYVWFPSDFYLWLLYGNIFYVRR